MTLFSFSGQTFNLSPPADLNNSHMCGHESRSGRTLLLLSAHPTTNGASGKFGYRFCYANSPIRRPVKQAWNINLILYTCMCHLIAAGRGLISYIICIYSYLFFIIWFLSNYGFFHTTLDIYIHSYSSKAEGWPVGQKSDSATNMT